MLSAVEFVDHSDRIRELIDRKIRAGLAAAAERLADTYIAGLQATIAPEHSKLGQIPHAYLGHKPGGFGPVNGYGEINNTVSEGFSRDQTAYLSNYIHGTGTPQGQKLKAIVGFRESHVTTRGQNYLLWHNQNGRPWVIRLYDRSRNHMIGDFRSAFEGTT